jgi:hypothetical protein
VEEVGVFATGVAAEEEADGLDAEEPRTLDVFGKERVAFIGIPSSS